MVFGEISEPSSRALWDEECDECVPVDTGKELTWKGNFEIPSSIIEKFVICESSCILNLIESCATTLIKPICELENGNTSIYRLNDNFYVLTFKSDPDVIVGNVTEKIMPWLNAAKSVFVVTSAPMVALQNCPLKEEVPCMIRMLSTAGFRFYPKLETPNLVTGLSASILSYCIFKDLKCTLYVSFLDNDKLDSVNVEPILELLHQIGVGPLKNFTSKFKLPSNNLYM